MKTLPRAVSNQLTVHLFLQYQRSARCGQNPFRTGSTEVADAAWSARQPATKQAPKDADIGKLVGKCQGALR